MARDCSCMLTVSSSDTTDVCGPQCVLGGARAWKTNHRLGDVQNADERRSGGVRTGYPPVGGAKSKDDAHPRETRGRAPASGNARCSRRESCTTAKRG